MRRHFTGRSIELAAHMHMNTIKFSIGRELLVVAVTLLLSVALLPGAIYLVGARLFGPYGGHGLQGIYRATLGDLFKFDWPAWIIVVGPTVAVLVLRWLFKLTRHEATPAPPMPVRKEPTIQD